MSYNKGLVVTLAELEQFYKGEKIGQIIELMNQTNDMLDDIQWMEANQTDGHRTRIRTDLPTVYWRRLYRGTPPSKSEWTEVKETTGMLEAVSEMDVEEAKLYADRVRAFRVSEGKAFTEAMRQKVAQTLFYGNHAKTPDEFNGFAVRYAEKKNPHVVDAGGTGDNLTSMYAINWGASTVHGIYPKGSIGGLEHEDLGKYMTQDAKGHKFQCFGDKYIWRCGLAVRDWRAVVRIVNIDVAALTKRKGEDGFIDLQALTIKAKNLMPEQYRNSAIWYCNSEVMTGLEMQSIDGGNVHLTYGEYLGSKAVPALHGRPIRQCDAIATNEKAVA